MEIVQSTSCVATSIPFHYSFQFSISAFMIIKKCIAILSTICTDSSPMGFIWKIYHSLATLCYLSHILALSSSKEQYRNTEHHLHWFFGNGTCFKIISPYLATLCYFFYIPAPSDSKEWFYFLHFPQISKILTILSYQDILRGILSQSLVLFCLNF